MAPSRLRNLGISVFVVAWLLVFHYETFRLRYLSPLVLRLRSAPALSEAEGLAGRELPKLKFLFPPAGWIMFFNVDQGYGTAEVYGFRRGEPFKIDPHAIFPSRPVLYDNIHRNVLISVLSRTEGERFCRYLRRKFPEYEAFAVAYAVYPDVVRQPGQKLYQLAYRCSVSDTSHRPVSDISQR